MRLEARKGKKGKEAWFEKRLEDSSEFLYEQSSLFSFQYDKVYLLSFEVIEFETWVECNWLIWPIMIDFYFISNIHCLTSFYTIISPFLYPKSCSLCRRLNCNYFVLHFTCCFKSKCAKLRAISCMNLIYLSTTWQLGESWTFKSWSVKTYVFESWTFNSLYLFKYGI